MKYITLDPTGPSSIKLTPPCPLVQRKLLFISRTNLNKKLFNLEPGSTFFPFFLLANSRWNIFYPSSYFWTSTILNKFILQIWPNIIADNGHVDQWSYEMSKMTRYYHKITKNQLEMPNFKWFLALNWRLALYYNFWAQCFKILRWSRKLPSRRWRDMFPKVPLAPPELRAIIADIRRRMHENMAPKYFG